MIRHAESAAKFFLNHCQCGKEGRFQVVLAVTLQLQHFKGMFSRWISHVFLNVSQRQECSIRSYKATVFSKMKKVKLNFFILKVTELGFFFFFRKKREL